MARRHSNGTNLVRKYKPQHLDEVRGHSGVTRALLSFVASTEREPDPAAFVFHGPTGVGKTCTAEALARDLGLDVEHDELGGFYQIASGKQDGKAVEDLIRNLHLRPFFGSGWRVAVINEADRMTPQAETIWLDALEHLPNKVVIIFTTNDLGRLADRLWSRCETYEFSGTSQEFRDELGELISEVWRKETGRRIRRLPEGLGRFELGDPAHSMRLALQQIAPCIRRGEPLPKSFCVPIVREISNGVSASGSTAARKAWDTRRRNGQNGKAVCHG